MKKYTEKELKSFALKYLSRTADELLEISVAYNLNDENKKINNKELDEIEAAMKWIKKQKIID